MKLIDKDALVAKIDKRMEQIVIGISIIPLTCREKADASLEREVWGKAKVLINSFEVKEVDNIWHEVDYINPPQADKNKIYCVFTKQKYILAKVINHPQDEDLLQWKCTEFPHHRYDMCEGDKYMQIV